MQRSYTIRSRTIFLFTTFLLLLSFIKPSPIYAQLGTGGCSDNEIETAAGCIVVDSQEDFVSFFIRWGAGIAGGVAFILLALAGIMIITSGGDPKRAQAGKELATAAVAGLFFLLFGVFILKFIGVDVLNIPEFGR